MDAVSDRDVETVVVMSGAQLGKTECVNNIVGYHVHQDPAPLLVLQPTLDMAQAWSKDRLAPMLRDSPVLAGAVRDPRSRDSGNTLLHKVFPGGHITMAGANSASSLASRPIRVVLADEVDRYPASAGTEGDPVSLATKRTATFWNRKVVLTSTPTVKGASRIEMAYSDSDQRRFYVPCPHCNEYQVLTWGQVQWPKGQPMLASYYCEHCGAAITDGQKIGMLRQGEWRADAEFNGIAGFHISGIYSPWATFATMAREFLLARANRETLKVWWNTFLGEAYEEEGDKVEAESIAERVEVWGDQAPEDVVFVTAGVDVQGDRLEVEIKGWGIGEESWSLGYHALTGDPAQDAVWQQLDQLLLTPIPSKLGMRLHIGAAAIDSGGHHTQAVYEFCRTRLGRCVFPIKGMSQAGHPVVSTPSRKNRLKIPLYTLGVDTAKERLMGWLRVSDHGPGFMHFPKGRDIEYFRQLTAEKQVTRYHKGIPRREWVKTRARNEALDCNVYAYAALLIRNVNLTALSTQMRDTSPPPQRHEEEETRRPSGGWIQPKRNWIRR